MTETPATSPEAVERLIEKLRNQLEYYNSGGRFTAAIVLEELLAENAALRARAEAAEAKVREAALDYLVLDGQAIEALAEVERLRMLLRRVPASLNSAFAAGTEERENGSARRQRALMEPVEALRVEIRAAFTTTEGKSNG